MGWARRTSMRLLFQTDTADLTGEVRRGSAVLLGISTVFATNWYRFCDVHFCAFFAFFLAFCLHSVQRDAFSSCISERIFVHLQRIFAHLKALCCILSARTLLSLGVHLLCIHDAPFLDQCLMCILPAFLHFVFHDILTHSKRILCAFVPIPR